MLCRRHLHASRSPSISTSLKCWREAIPKGALGPCSNNAVLFLIKEGQYLADNRCLFFLNTGFHPRPASSPARPPIGKVSLFHPAAAVAVAAAVAAVAVAAGVVAAAAVVAAVAAAAVRHTG